MGRKYYQERVSDSTELLKRYHEAARGRATDGDDLFTNYRARRRTQIRLVEAPWRIVFLWALVNAIAINAIKYTYFYFCGKPEVFLLAEELDSYNRSVSGVSPMIEELEADSHWLWRALGKGR